ncbi:MAG: exodeoxyribonuclease III [Anaerolineaceae bacterium]|nr:exodeoxyribonuclease III [Anaerolineaceae bacterium]
MTRLKLLSWNVNGIRAVARKGALEEFTQLGADILCVQETKAQLEQLDESITALNGYTSYFSDAQRKGYSGTAIYTLKAPEKVETGIGIERFDNEGRTVIADYGDFVLLNHYYPNGKQSNERLQYKMDFYDAVMDYTDKLVASGRNVIICGDVNTAHQPIDLARPAENEKVSGFLPEERAWIDEFLSHGYVDTFRMFHPDEPEQYSWWSLQTRARERNVGWRIDYFFVNEGFKDRVKDAFIMMDFEGSDHCPIGIEIELD